MAHDHSADEPLLLNLADAASENPPRSAFAAAFVKWVLSIAMWLLLGFWVAVTFTFPSDAGTEFLDSWTSATSGSLYGITGSIFLLCSGPILIIVVLAIASLMFDGKTELQLKTAIKFPRIQLRTFPVLVDGPFGVVSAAEFIGICLFVVFTLWALYAYTMQNLQVLSEVSLSSEGKWILMMALTGLRFGTIGLYCLAFLFLPISRGSVLLSIIDIPFEQATRYHVWLGHLTMLLFTLHGLCYVVAWALEGRLLDEIVGWADEGIAVLPGVISLTAGLLMWVTTLVREKNFELFFYTHQLYVVFVVFLALHVGDFIFCIATGGIFLFVIDRFLRFCQSRRTVDVISATCLPCGSVELVFSKPASLQYTALSFIFIQIRELSCLQWHPFSVSSSPLAGRKRISVLIKVLGGWTSKLKSTVLRMSGTEGENGLRRQSHSKITASVEGPYGHEIPYHLAYENLILVAGGSGISPFLAVLSDILHLTRQGKPCLPKNVLVIWAIRKSNELHMLSTLDAESICPDFRDKLDLEVHVYVTRESGPPLEEGNTDEGVGIVAPVSPLSRGSGMSVLVGTGNRAWSGAYVISCIVGFAVSMALLDIFYINPLDIVSWWYKGLLLVGCMISSVIVFGGPVVYLWHRWEKRAVAVVVEADADDGEKDDESQQSAHLNATQDDVVPKERGVSRTIHYGARPNFAEIFTPVSERWGNVDIGVIVCGPATLRSSVARKCRSQNLRRGALRPVFHFNSHSFDL